ncbi:hypothetical protein SPRG_08772 [Saprolegnia parasitica CBS 223.65]|uniref:FYVE-type domain-containing protein n=1 Tax=Saprolegnia parasitica (strain CBS 223.65) TaxID=695850 RepID=A0A067C5P2_SAPPC|nr:hypothetical protein SPRG_08772 [Saprolegnia parasitica CBS 223.65]KDO25828.1 hypothetical protein SPRG_08772 [Saprolegnia parasitica CBS 223.65]|eukprot:XP_012203392.1 hypothetical protein SPRG_08772 [Saprolegnia parasitica CBS 223.65]
MVMASLTTPPKARKPPSEGFMANVSLQFENWRKRMQQPEGPPSPEEAQQPHLPAFSDAAECHVCHDALTLLKFKHNCRNCGKSVCGAHSKNQLPLPELGILKEVRVCDVCYQLKVSRRAGARDLPPPTSPLPTMAMTGPNPRGSSLCGILYSGLVEEQDDMLDEMLYLGSFRLGSRSLASRNFNPNIAIWIERLFMLTPAELLCFKPQKEKEDFLLGIGEVRTSIHLTDILHIDVDENYPRILTVIRSDGRIFRIRTKEPETCALIYEKLRETIQTFQDALHKLQRGLVPEDNAIACVTVQHAPLLDEVVVPKANDLGYHVSLYPTSVVRAYCLGPSSVHGVASFARDEIAAATSQRLRKRVEPSMDELYLVLHLGAQRTVQYAWQDVGLFGLQLLVWTLVFAYGMTRYFEAGILLWSMMLVVLGVRLGPHMRLAWHTRALATSYRLELPQIDCQKQKTSAGGDLKESDVDPRFLAACDNDLEEAKRKYIKYLQWRDENAIDTILLRPHPHFHIIKESYVHLTHKQDKQGHMISIELAGNMKKGMANFMSKGVVEADVVTHLGFYNEFLWNVIDRRPAPFGTQLKILDLNGVALSDFGGDVVAFMKQCSAVGEAYYPERLYKVFIVNPPSWFNMIWKAVSPLVNPKTREKINVVKGQKEIQKALLEYIDPENLPVEYGGTCECVGGCLTHSPDENLLREYVDRLNSGEDCSEYLQSLMDAAAAVADATHATAPAVAGTDPDTKMSSRHSATNLAHLDVPAGPKKRRASLV